MKRLLSIFSGLLCMSFSAFAQTNEKQAPAARPTVTKGYYSIGNNAAKLAAASGTNFQSVSDTTQRQEAGKGYYSMNNNRKKLRKQTIAIPAASTKRVERPTKGYYSIGNNAEKLNK